MSKAQVNIKFFADLRQFSSQMQNAQRQLKKTGRQMKSIGRSMSIGVTAPMAAFAAVSLKAWDKQEKAIAQVNAGLKSTGGLVGFTSKELQTMAADLQKSTLFGDEEILKGATSQLLTFTNIAGEQFARTQSAALDLATRLDGDLKSASIQLGKALNDPVANLSALSRSGIQFSDSQKTVINEMVKTNRLAEAQTLILDELEKQYGGSAAAAAQAGTGWMKQMQNTFGDIAESFGPIFNDILKPMAEKLKDIADKINDLSPGAKKLIVVFGGIAAAIGPLLALAGTILPAIGTGLALLTGPIGLIVAGLTAVGVIIYKNWAPIKQTLVDIANYFIDLYNESSLFRGAIDLIIINFKNWWDIAKFVFNAMVSIVKSVVSSFVDGFAIIGKVIKGALTLDSDLIAEAWNDFKTVGLNTTAELVKNLSGDWEQLKSDLSANIQQGIEGGGQRAKITLTADQVDTTAVSDAVSKAISNPTSKPVASTLKQFGTDEGVQTKGVKGFETKGFDTSVGDDQVPWSQAQIEQMDAFIAKQQEIAEVAQIVGGEVGFAFDNMATGFLDSLNLADNGFEGFVKNLGKTIIKLISQLLAQSIAHAIAGATASGAATGPAAVFSTPAFIATAVGGVLAAFAAIPKFADGGLAYGPTLGLFGEYAGASSNPEVIAPLDKLKELIQPAAGVQAIDVNVIGSINGRDIKLSIDRTNQQFNRIR